MDTAHHIDQDPEYGSAPKSLYVVSCIRIFRISLVWSSTILCIPPARAKLFSEAWLILVRKQ